MNILIVGVSGFIGRYLYDALSQKQHHVIGCSRYQVPHIHWLPLNFNQNMEEWETQLSNIELVINAVGIFQQSHSASNSFLQVHEVGPKKLFSACKKKNIKVIQISAIGAEQGSPLTEFLQTKRNADQALLNSNQNNVVLYPGIVLGEQGKTTQQLSLLAKLYFIPLAFGKNQTLPLISIEQLTQHIVSLIQHWPNEKKATVLIAKGETMEELLNHLRQWMGLSKGYFFTIPKSLINLTFFLFPRLSFGAFNKQSLEMFTAHSKKHYTPVTTETASESLLNNMPTKTFRQSINLKLLFYINLITLSFIWIASGLSSLINMEQSRELILFTGLTGTGATTIIFIAAIGDIVLGLLLYVSYLRRKVIFLQLSVILIYSLIISIALPMYWLHPFAPIIKNLAMIVLALYLLIEEKE